MQVVRHEIMLHLAVTLGGAEFCPFCTQIRSSRSQVGTHNQPVLFLGTYSDNHMGIYDLSVYQVSMYGSSPSSMAKSASPVTSTNGSGAPPQSSLNWFAKFKGATRRCHGVDKGRTSFLCVIRDNFF